VGWPPVDLTRPAPSLRPHYKAFIATTGRSAPVPRIGTLRLGVCSPWRSPSRRPGGTPHPSRLAVTIGATGSPVPCQRLRRAHATSTPDTARTATRPPPDFQRPDQRARLHPGNSAIPRFRCHRSPFRCVTSGSLTFVFFVAHLTAQWRPFPQRSPPRLLTAAACGGLGPPPDRRSRRANLHHQHSTVRDNDLLHRHHSPFRTHRGFGDRCYLSDASPNAFRHLGSAPRHPAGRADNRVLLPGTRTTTCLESSPA
jgi:hypothetical protein